VFIVFYNTVQESAAGVRSRTVPDDFTAMSFRTDSIGMSFEFTRFSALHTHSEEKFFNSYDLDFMPEGAYVGPMSLSLRHCEASGGGSTRLFEGYHYVGTHDGGQPLDTDNDQAPNYLEDADGDGVQDANETSLTDVDTDYDGRSDSEEVVEGTNPLNPGDKMPTRIAHLRFNSSDLKGEEGQIPLATNGVQWVSSFDGSAVQFTTAGAGLRYRCVEATGKANLTLSNGSVRLRFKPSWTSPIAGGGSGSGASEAYLLNVGDRLGNPSAGYFEFFITQNGNALYARSSSGSQTAQSSSLVLTNNPFLNGQ